MNRRSFFFALVSMPFIVRQRPRVVRTRWIKMDAAYWRRAGLSPRIHKVDWGAPALALMIRKKPSDQGSAQP